MTGSLARVGRVAVTEVSVALRSRRVLVSTLLFLAVMGGVMYLTISIFSAMETGLATTLKLPETGAPGSMSLALWRAKPFVRAMEHFAGSSLVFADIKGRHPILLTYALLLFHLVPLLALVVSAPKVADDVRSGAARYWLVRVTRTEWSLGKFFGEALMIAGAMAVGAIGAWCVMLCRLPVADALSLFAGVFDWTVRAWVYAFAWLGMFVGLSHLVESGGKATALGIIAAMGAVAWCPLLGYVSGKVGGLGWLVHLDALVPSSSWSLLWRRSPSAVLQGVVHLSALAFLYLSFGAAFFRRRDV